jgi:crotonobetaine/carnitine-CoA ligase
VTVEVESERDGTGGGAAAAGALDRAAGLGADAIAVPVNPRYTRREVQFMLDDAEATWFVVAEDLAGLCAGIVPAANVIVAGAAGGHPFTGLLDHVETPRTHRAGRRDVVNIQFTSGTTGLPKGCLLTHEYWIEMGVYSAALFDDPQHVLADHPFYYMQNQSYFAKVLAGGGQLHVTPGLSRRRFLGGLVDLDIDYAWIDEDMLNFETRRR